MFLVVAFALPFGWVSSVLAQNSTVFQVNSGSQVRAIEVIHKGPTTVIDSDMNGLPDAWELLYFGRIGVDPDADQDGDGLVNFLEWQHGTNPTMEDSDSDGLSDGQEIALGSDPLKPSPVAVGQTTWLTRLHYSGNPPLPSGSGPWTTEAPFAFLFDSPVGPYSASAEFHLLVPPGATGVVRWLEVFYPHWEIDSEQYTVREWSITAEKSPPFILNAPADGSVEVVFLPELAVDANRDGIIKLPSEDATDTTSASSPFRFWVNDDDDGIYTDLMESEEDDLNITDSNNEDWRDNVIDTPRDLEDFARLHLYVGGLSEAFRNGTLYLGLKWADTNGTSPSIKLYRATSPADNDTAYLGEGTAANRQSLEVAIIDARYPAYSGGNFQSDHTQIGTGGFFVLPAEQALLLTDQNPTLRFIFEACTTGKGQLKLVILKKEGTTYTEIGDGPGVWLDIKKPHEFIQRWTCGDGSLATVQPVQFDAAKSGTFAAPTKDEEKDLILYVHGYNMQADWEKQRWIETNFKRLYWLGYKGRVGGFVWPCVLDGPSQFNASEERAWQSGEQLKALLQQLKEQGYRVHVLGHSQGNVVVGEALRQAGPDSGLVSTYVSSQSALAVHAYDASRPDRSGPIAFTPSTPNVYARFWTSLQDPNLPETWGSGSPSYFAPTYTQGAADKFVNFYNPQDYALTGNGVNPLASDGSQTGWLINQRLKPWIGYDYASYIGFRESPLTNFSPRLFRFPDDRFVIFSFGAQARSIALGAGASGGVFNGGNVNLFDAPTEYRGHHVFHSGQFRSNYAYRWAYWRQLMISCDLAGRNAP